MINAKYRFHGLGSLNYVYKRGKTYRSGFLTLKIIPSKKSDYQLAVVVSKKVNKLAVVRNRIRRRIFEIARKTKKNQAKPWPYQMIITVHNDSIAKISHKELELCLTDLFKKAGVI